MTQDDNHEIRYLGNVQRLCLEPGDVLVLMTDEILSADRIESLRSQLIGAFPPEHKLVVLGRGMKLGVVSASPVPAA